MPSSPEDSTVAVMLSGGLDSAILAGHLLRNGRPVQPVYVQSNLVWQQAELLAVQAYLAQLGEEYAGLRPLVILELPLADLYGGHWSLTGDDPPDALSPDEAVYLPGRNLLLLVKAGLWCQLHGIGQLALGVLGSNPFADATAGFFDAFEAAVNGGAGTPLQIVRPFGALRKCQVMELGRGLPLERTFSCIAPVSGQHCGRCNKCAERQSAFRQVGWPDPTLYAGGPAGERTGRPTTRPDESQA